MEQSVGTRRRGTTDAGTTSKADKAKEQVQEKAKEGQGGQARDSVRDQVDQRSTQAGEQVRSSCERCALGRGASCASRARMRRRATRSRRPTGQSASAATSHDADGDRILRDVEDFAPA